MENERVFGNSLIGDWICSECGYHVFPNTLRNKQEEFIWARHYETKKFRPVCPECGNPLQYDEAE